MAAIALGKIGAAAHDAVIALEVACEDKDLYCAAQAVWQIANRTEKPVLVLVELLKEKDRHVNSFFVYEKSLHVLALRVLGEIGQEAQDAIPQLRRLLTSENAATREAASACLAKIQMRD
jgi:hypothetical protein